jgi:hypothetical protein
MREIRMSGSEGGGESSLPLSESLIYKAFLDPVFQRGDEQTLKPQIFQS